MDQEWTLGYSLSVVANASSKAGGIGFLGLCFPWPNSHANEENSCSAGLRSVQVCPEGLLKCTVLRQLLALIDFESMGQESI